MNKPTQQQIDEVLTRGVAEVIDQDHLRERLLDGSPLRVKLGIDPTSPDLHLGRSVPLLKLKDLQDLGHHIILLVGNATGVIGDTSDKDAERPMLTHADIKRNMASYKEQAAKLLDMDKVEFVYNADWLNTLGYKEIGEHADAFSLHEFIARDNIKRRLDAGNRVSLREVLYPLMQGYDSVELRADIELGGTDQRFNLLAGRTLQQHFGQEPQDIIMTNLILGTDGRKMSSSWGNTITLTDAPEVMMEKLMNLPDDLVEIYFTHCTRVPLETITELCAQNDQRQAKAALVQAIVALYHDDAAATEMQARAVAQFIEKTHTDLREEAVLVQEGSAAFESLVDYMVRIGFATSKGDARRKITQGGVSLGDQKVTDEHAVFTKDADGKVLKVGKKQFMKVVF